MTSTSGDAHVWYHDVPRDSRTAIAAGVLISVAFFGVFGVWAFTAPIAGAVITAGVFVTQGQNKIIQSMEGGVISRILVHEGDQVEKGEDLIAFDPTAAKADLRRLVLKQARFEAVEARLLQEAGQGGVPTPIPIDYHPDAIASLSDADIESVLLTQKMTYDAHMTTLRSDVANLERSIASLEDHIRGDEDQLLAMKSQSSLFQQEIATKRDLLDKGLVKRSEYLALLRAKAGVQGEIGRLQADVGDTQNKISRVNEQIAGVRATAVKTAAEQLVEVRAELLDTRERILTQQKVADRVAVPAPVRGIIVKLGYHTPGGVVEPGKAIMEILPLDDELLIEGRVRSQDIDSVKMGSKAVVRLSALSARITPMVTGVVTYVSADSIQDDPRLDRSAGMYVVRVKVDQDQKQLIKGFKATPGMPAEIYIATRERTFFDYLVRPIRDSMARAFREN